MFQKRGGKSKRTVPHESVEAELGELMPRETKETRKETKKNAR